MKLVTHNVNDGDFVLEFKFWFQNNPECRTPGSVLEERVCKILVEPVSDFEFPVSTQKDTSSLLSAVECC